MYSTGPQNSVTLVLGRPIRGMKGVNKIRYLSSFTMACKSITSDLT